MPKAPRRLPTLPPPNRANPRDKDQARGSISFGSKASASQPVDHLVKRSGAIEPGQLPGFSLAQRQTKASPRGSERGFLAGGAEVWENLKHRSCRCAEGSRKISKAFGPSVPVRTAATRLIIGRGAGRSPQGGGFFNKSAFGLRLQPPLYKPAHLERAGQIAGRRRRRVQRTYTI